MTKGESPSAKPLRALADLKRLGDREKHSRTVVVLGHSQGSLDDAFAMMGLAPFWPFSSQVEYDAQLGLRRKTVMASPVAIPEPSDVSRTAIATWSVQTRKPKP